MPVDTSSFTPEQLKAYNYAASLAPTPPKTATPTLLTSKNGATAVNQGTQKLQQIESAYMGPSIVDYLKSQGKPADRTSLQGIASQQGIQNYRGTAEQNTQMLNTLRNLSGSPASQAMVDEVNRTVGNGGLSPDNQAHHAALIAEQDKAARAAAEARSALSLKNYSAFDAAVKRADESRAAYDKMLADYHAEIAPLRQQYASSLTPTAREQELGKQLLTLRAEADQFNLQTEQDKLAEYEGQTMGFAGGRAAEIDFKSSFRKQEQLLKEKNLLAELGLEQDTRKAIGDAANAQLGYLADDVELQAKVQERLQEQEEKLMTYADKLESEAQTTLFNIIDKMGGIDPAQLSPETRTAIETFSARAGLPHDLVNAALKTEYQKQVFENALKASQEARLGGSVTTPDGFRPTPAPTTASGYKFTDTQKNQGANNAGVDMATFNTFPPEVQNYYINSTNEQLEAISSEFAAVQAGKKTPAEVASLIDQSNSPDQVKTFLKAKLGSVKATPKKRGTFEKAAVKVYEGVNNSWDSLRSFLGI